MSLLNIKKSYRVPLIIAVLLHVSLMILLTMHLSNPAYRWQQALTQPAMVNATAIDQSVLNKQIQHIKNEQTAIQRQQAARLERIERQALLAKQQRLAEQQRLEQLKVRQAELKQQQLQQAAALKQQQEQEQLAKQNAEAWQKKTKQALAKRQHDLQQQLLDSQIQAEQNQINQEKRQLSAALNAQQEGEIDKYRALILQAIQNNWHPLIQDSNLYCQLIVHVAPGGVVTSVDLVKSSGDLALDRSAQLAILKSSPLPVPEDRALFDRFRQFRIKMTPQEVKGA